jgi:hypothetical protein
MTEFDDGTYDVMIIDATEGDDGVVHIEFVISSGAHRGESLRVSARHLTRDAIDLLGLPATLHVIDGAPHLEFE